MQDTADHEATRDAGSVSPRRQWVVLLAGLLAILVGVEQLVHQVNAIGIELGLSQFLLGVTIVAAATSLPDALVSVRAAREDRSVASLANVLGSNTFDFLVAIPVGVLLVGSTTINFAMALPLFGALTGATILLFTTLRMGMALTQSESYALFTVYLLFIAWVLAEVSGTIVGILPK